MTTARRLRRRIVASSRVVLPYFDTFNLLFTFHILWFSYANIYGGLYLTFVLLPRAQFTHYYVYVVLLTPPLMNWQNIWKSILIFMYLPSSIFILHKYLAWIFYWQDRRRKIRILLQKGLIFKKNLIEEDLRCSVILNIESTAWDLYCDSFSSQFVHLSVFRDLLICLL